MSNRRKLFSQLSSYSALGAIALFSKSLFASSFHVQNLFGTFIQNPKSLQSVFEDSLGVCSGEPSETGVTLWWGPGKQFAAKYSEILFPKASALTAQLCVRNSQNTIVFVGELQANLAGNFQHVCVSLEPGSTYYYQFECMGFLSEVGRAKTLPVGNVQNLQVAYVSCQDYCMGYYNVYSELCNENPDFCVHLGDYIYENSYPSARLVQVRHENIGNGEAKTLTEYRDKYELYLSDKALQEARRLFTWIFIPDDHEVIDNYGGKFLSADARKVSAMQAYCEYMPVASSVQFTSNRSFEFGSLVNLQCLDVRRFRTPLVCKSEKFSTLCDEARNNNRTMMGEENFTHLAKSLQTSKQLWNLIASPLVVMPLRVLTPSQGNSEFDAALSRKFREESIEKKWWPDWLRLNEERFFSLDGWDGYPAERSALFDAFQNTSAANIVISGDVHNVYGGYCVQNEKICGFEFCGGSVTSAGFGEVFTSRGANALFRQYFLSQNSHLVHTDLGHHTYTLVTFTSESARIQNIGVSTIRRHSYRKLFLFDQTFEHKSLKGS